MFSQISIHNFRAIGPKCLSLDLAPVTILVGPNGAGKSSVLEALALTAQSALAAPNLSDLELQGPLISFPSFEGEAWYAPYKRLYHRHSANQSMKVAFTLDTEPSLSYSWERRGQETVHWAHKISRGGKSLFEWVDNGISQSGNGAMLRVGQKEEVCANQAPSRPLSSKLLRVPVAWALEHSAFPLVREAIEDFFQPHFRGLSFLSAMRGTSLMHRDTGPDVRVVGRHGEMTVRLLANLEAKARPAYRKIKEWGERFGLGQLEAGWAGGNQLKVVFHDPYTGTALDLMEGATGSRQSLMLASNLLLSGPHATVLLEEPENDLHPAYEKLLPDLFADAVEEGNQVIATTHSEVLVASLAQAVRKGRLAPEQVAIWHLERDQDGVHGERLEMSARGNLKEWVKSFAAVEEEIYDEWWEELPEVGD